MQIRPAQPHDLSLLIEIDGTIEASNYLHLEREGEDLSIQWRIEERSLAEKLIDPNAVTESQQFWLRQILDGIQEGVALIAEHDQRPVALALAAPDAERSALELLDLRVDYDHRHQGLGSALLYQVISHARTAGLRAVSARTLTNNVPAAQFLLRAGFDLCGVDTRYYSNHDLVKESVAMFWYAALD